MKRVVVLTGAGISAESGIRTFRDSDGLWEEHRIEDVATPAAWHRNRSLVLEFYNLRRRQVLDAQPNAAHRALVDLEKNYEVTIVTQNVDDLHERAGSSHVLHLHGEIRKSRSSLDPSLVYDIEGWELKEGDRCAKGAQLRPHIVWFGEEVPLMESAVDIVGTADLLIVVGTSLAVYPAAGLIQYVPVHAGCFLIDPNAPTVGEEFTIIRKKAGDGVPELVQQLLIH